MMTTTTTRPVPPTEAEVRMALADPRWDGAWNNFTGRAEDLYVLDDLRQSEIADLDRLFDEAKRDLFARATRELTDATVAAMAAFAELHPDAPRRYFESREALEAWRWDRTFGRYGKDTEDVGPMEP